MATHLSAGDSALGQQRRVRKNFVQVLNDGELFRARRGKGMGKKRDQHSVRGSVNDDDATRLQKLKCLGRKVLISMVCGCGEVIEQKGYENDSLMQHKRFAGCELLQMMIKNQERGVWGERLTKEPEAKAEAEEAGKGADMTHRHRHTYIHTNIHTHIQTYTHTYIQTEAGKDVDRAE